MGKYGTNGEDPGSDQRGEQPINSISIPMTRDENSPLIASLYPVRN